MTKRGTIQQIADQTSVDQATVRRAIKAAGLNPKTVTFEQALPIVNAIADADRVIGHATLGRGEGGDADNISLVAQMRAEQTRQQIEKIRIQNERALGKLIDRDAVTETAIHIVTTARTALLSLGYRLAEQVAGKTDLAEIAGLIESEVRIVMGELADESKFTAALDAGALE